MKLPHTTITQTTLIPAGDFQAPDSNTYELPAFCRIQGVANPNEHSHIKFEVWLPQYRQNWNKRYYQFGQGGEAGQIAYSALANYLKEGSAVASTDDGHTIDLKAPYAWALNNPERVIDWGYRALKETADAAGAIIQQYYQQPANYRYFSGCSRGGQQALVAAQRYPEDWDGVLAVAPDPYLVPWFFRLMQRGARWKYHQENRIPQSMLPVIQHTALKSCTIKAGVIDGIATNPEQCTFDPSILACKHKSDRECLTEGQIETLQEIYNGPRFNEASDPMYLGYPATLETSWKGWMPIEGTYNEAIGNISLMIGEAFYRNVIFSNPQWNEKKWLYKDLTERRISGQTLSAILNADNPDLTRFKKGNGKIMMFFGWADAAIPPSSGIEYYNEVVNTMGGLDTTQDFFRLFMAPGMEHCIGGPGANAFDQWPVAAMQTPLKDDVDHSATRALEAWVEKDSPPRKIIATKYQQDDPKKGVLFTRLLCPYPQQAILTSKSNTKEASSFTCKQP